ncbi:hypothetical protein R6M67_47380 [Streptomyces sp. Wh19]|nr:hypothetical protein [Streptomyces sp. Wh19]MDV9202782.1 hypothetical protein [Streptomyces sp. Wh19]
MPAPVETAQTGHGRTAEQQGIACGDGREFADVVAVRQVAEQFHPASARTRRKSGAVDDLTQQVPVAMARGGREGGVDHRGPLPHHAPLRGFPSRLPRRTLSRIGLLNARDMVDKAYAELGVAPVDGGTDEESGRR